MVKLISLVDGSKTYIFAGLLVLTFLAHLAGYIDGPTAANLETVFAAGAVASVRDAIRKLEDNFAEVKALLQALQGSATGSAISPVQSKV